MKIKNKTILITGGDGFIGSAIAERLVKNNFVIIYDIGERKALRFTDIINSKRCRFIKGDVLNYDSLRKASKGCDIIIHMAAIAGVSQYYLRPTRTLEVNIVGSLNALKAAEKNRIQKFIYTSSSEIYGGRAYNVREEMPTYQGPATESRWTYSVSKLAGEHLAMSFYRERALPVVSLRPFNIYGQRQIHPCAVQIMTLNALREKQIIVHGRGLQTRAWCYVEDYVDATILALEKKEAVGELFNIGNPKETVTTLELAKKIRGIAGSKSKIVFKKNPYLDIKERRPDMTKARKILGFKAQTGLEEGLEKTIFWYRKNIDAFEGQN